MLQVLEERAAMRAQEPSGLSIEKAREVPDLAQAARAISNVKGLPAPTTEIARAEQVFGTGAEGPLSVKLFRTPLARDTPAILYFAGGTWPTTMLDSYEESARQLAQRTGWVVVLMATRRPPEARFPAAHEDALSLYQWARAHLREWGADPTRVALAGEGPGANLALSTAIAARDRARAGSTIAVPDHLLLITPLAGTDLSGASMSENRRAQPLTRATVDWAQDLYAPDDLAKPRLDLRRADMAGMPPTTIILAEIDPLRSQGEALASQLAAAGVPTEARLFPGTTYDFFGLGTVVPEAAAAEDYAAARLRTAFARSELPVLQGPVRRARSAGQRSNR